MKKYLFPCLMALLALAQPAKGEITDISGIDNVIYISPLQLAAGGTFEISLNMKNSAAIRGYQCDLYLPNGVTVVEDDEGYPVVTLSTERTTAKRHTVEGIIQPDGALRFLSGAQRDYTYSGNDGEVARVSVKVDASMVPGVYPVILKNIKLTETDISKTYSTAYVETTLTVTDASDNRVILDENATTAPSASSGAVEVLVKRTLKAGQWSTICLPFEMTEAQVHNIFGTDVQLAEFIDYEVEDDASTEITVNFEDAYLSTDGFMANYPYLIKTSKDITEFSVTATIDPDEEGAVAEYTNGRTGSRKVVYGSFIGTYHAGDKIPAKCLFLSGNKFWYSAGNTTLKAYRGYFDFQDVLANVDASLVKFNFYLGGIETRIDNIETSESANGAIYDLGGRKITKPQQRGVYIVNGQKVIVK